MYYHHDGGDIPFAVDLAEAAAFAKSTKTWRREAPPQKLFSEETPMSPAAVGLTTAHENRCGAPALFLRPDEGEIPFAVDFAEAAASAKSTY